MPTKKKGGKKAVSKSIERSKAEVKKVNKKAAHHRNTALLQDKFDEQVEELMKFLFDRLKNKETQVIDRNALMKAITNLGLWNDIFEEDIDDMLELFTENGNVDYNTLREIFMRCRINVKGFIDD